MDDMTTVNTMKNVFSRNVPGPHINAVVCSDIWLSALIKKKREIGMRKREDKRKGEEERESKKRPLSRRQAHAHVTGVLNSTRLTDFYFPLSRGKREWLSCGGG